jgi:hypothetical protein
MFVTVNIKKFPRGISDQAISLTNRVLLNRVLACTWSGLKVSSCKLQASSKYQAFEPTFSIAKRQASQPE